MPDIRSDLITRHIARRRIIYRIIPVCYSRMPDIFSIIPRRRFFIFPLEILGDAVVQYSETRFIFVRRSVYFAQSFSLKFIIRIIIIKRRICVIVFWIIRLVFRYRNVLSLISVIARLKDRTPCSVDFRLLTRIT